MNSRVGALESRHLLFIMGEYDILNDLVYDGVRRLRDNAGATDLELLRQNDPCAPPDRSVPLDGGGATPAART
jgi:hypothetical protein